MAEYLTQLISIYGRHPLLEKHAPGIDLEKVWQPLRCVERREEYERRTDARTKSAVGETEVHGRWSSEVGDTTEFHHPVESALRPELGRGLSSTAEYIAYRPESWADFRVCTFLGDPGSGKSELLRRQVRERAQQQAAVLQAQTALSSELCPPVFVALRTVPQLLRPEKEIEKQLLERIGRSVTRALGSQREEWVVPFSILLAAAAQQIPALEHIAGAVARHWSCRMSEGEEAHTPPLLCLDGLDELRGAAFEEVRTLLQPLLAPSPSCLRMQIVLSSRFHGYQRLMRYREPRLLPFRPPEIDAYIESFFHAGDREFANFTGSQVQSMVRNLLRENPSIFDSCANPFILTMLCIDCFEKLRDGRINLRELRLPGTRSELYYDILRRILGDEASKSRPGSPDHHDLSTARKIELLAHAALQMSPETSISTTEIEVLFCNEKELLKQLLENDCIFTKRSEAAQHLSFLHLTFQEYLAAAALVAHQQLPEELLRCSYLPVWTQVVRMTLGLLTLPEKRRCRNIRPAWTLQGVIAAWHKIGGLCSGYFSMLLASGVADIGALEEGDLAAICETLFRDWCRAQGTAADTAIVTQPIERAFFVLQRSVVNRARVHEWLAVQLEDESTACLAASLLRAANIFNPTRRLARAVFGALRHDSVEAGWPVHLYLTSAAGSRLEHLAEKFARRPTAEETKGLDEFLRMNVISRPLPMLVNPEEAVSEIHSVLTEAIQLRELLTLDDPPGVAYLREHPKLLCTVAILFGGFNYLGMERCLARRAALVHDMLSPAQFGRRHSAACELDLEISPWLQLIRNEGLDFRAESIFMPSPLDEAFTGWIRNRLPVPQIVQELAAIIQAESANDAKCAEAYVACYCLAPEKAPEIDIPEIRRREIAPLLRRRASVLEKILRDAMIRAGPLARDSVVKASIERQPMTLGRAHVKDAHALWRIHQIHRRYGGQPLKLASDFHLLPEPMRVVALGEFMAAALNGSLEDDPGFTNDTCYNMMVTLDTIGGPLSDPAVLTRWLRWVPWSESARQERGLANVCFEDAHSSAERELTEIMEKETWQGLAAALDVIYHSPAWSYPFQGWALANLVPLIAEIAPAMLAEVLLFAQQALQEDCYRARSMVLSALARVGADRFPDSVDTMPSPLAVRWCALAVSLREHMEDKYLPMAQRCLNRVNDSREKARSLELLSVNCRSDEVVAGAWAFYCRTRRDVSLKRELPHRRAISETAPEYLLRCGNRLHAFLQKFVAGGSAFRRMIQHSARLEHKISLPDVSSGTLPEHLLRCGERLHVLLRNLGEAPEADLDACWNECIRDPQNVEKQASFVQRVNTTGFLLTRSRAMSLEHELPLRGARAFVSLLRKIPRVARCAVFALRAWLHSADDESFRDICALLLLEHGLCPPSVAARIGRLLESGDDLIRQRTHVALYPKSEAHAGWVAGRLGQETLLKVADQAKRYGRDRPGLALHVGWFLDRIIFDNAQIVAEFYKRALREGRDCTAAHVLGRMQLIDGSVLEYLLQVLPNTPTWLSERLFCAGRLFRTCGPELLNRTAMPRQIDACLRPIVERQVAPSAALAAYAWRNFINCLGLEKTEQNVALGGLLECLQSRLARWTEADGDSTVLLVLSGRIAEEVAPGLLHQLADELTGKARASFAEVAWFLEVQEALAVPLCIAIVALLLEHYEEERALEVGAAFAPEQWVSAMQFALDSPLISESLLSKTKFCAWLLARNEGCLQAAAMELEQLLKKNIWDPTTYGSDAHILFPRSNLLMLLDGAFTLAPRLRQTVAPRLTLLQCEVLRECAIRHNAYPGRRAAIRLLALTTGGAESALIAYGARTGHDVGVVSGIWAALRCQQEHAENLLAAAEEASESARSSPRTVMVMLNMVANSVTHQETSNARPLPPLILRTLLRIKDREVSYFEPTDEFSKTFVSSSLALQQRIVTVLYQKLGMMDQPLQAGRFDCVCCDIAASAIFPQAITVAPETLPLYISEIPVAGKRIAEYQLRHYLRRLYGAQNVNTADWFMNVTNKAAEGSWSIVRFILTIGNEVAPPHMPESIS